FFVPNSDMPEMAGLLVQAMIKAGGAIPLLPGGTAKLVKDGDVTGRARARDLKLGGDSITGLGLTPTHVWMNEGGSWFGVTTPWWSVIPEGTESAIEPLIEKQNQIDRARDARLAKDQAHRPPAAGLALTHARVLDVEHGKWLADQTIVVVGDAIKSVGP